jgi:hypothetical protein
LFTAYGDSVVASGAPEKSFEVALTAEGVKARIVKGSYLPNHNFFGPEDRNMTIGFIELPDGIELLPGQSLEALLENDRGWRDRSTPVGDCASKKHQNFVGWEP